MSDESMGIWFFVIFCGGIVLFGIGGCAGERLGIKNHREDAVKAGVAEFYLDANAEKAFRWKTNHFEK